jgi:hypothetical protein
MSSNIDHRGKFQLWSYSVGHGLLLLRSPKSKVRATQVDILFKNVAALKIPTVFNDVHIKEVLFDELQPKPELGDLTIANRKIFCASGQNFSGYIIADAVMVDESDREYDSISPLLQ